MEVIAVRHQNPTLIAASASVAGEVVFLDVDKALLFHKYDCMLLDA